MKKQFGVIVEDKNASVEETKFGITGGCFGFVVFMFIAANVYFCWLLFGTYPERFSEIVKLLLAVDTLTLILVKMLAKHVEK